MSEYVAPDEMDCPVPDCDGKLRKTPEEYYECSKCGGVFLPQDKFSRPKGIRSIFTVH